MQDKFDNDEIGAAVPSFDAVRSVLQRERTKEDPEAPKSRFEIELEGPWTKTLRGDDFLVINDGPVAAHSWPVADKNISSLFW